MKALYPARMLEDLFDNAILRERKKSAEEFTKNEIMRFKKGLTPTPIVGILEDWNVTQPDPYQVKDATEGRR
jgi:hypothetical protein